MKRSGRSIRLTILIPLVIGLIFLVTFGVVFGVNIAISRQIGADALQSATVPLVNSTAKLLFNPVYKLDVAAIQSIINQYYDGVDVIFVEVRGRDGGVLANTSSGWPEQALSASLATQALATGELVQSLQVGQYHNVSSISVGSERIGTVEFVFDVNSLQAVIQSAQQRLNMTMLILFIVGFLVSLGISRTVGVSWEKLADHARKIAGGDLDTPVVARGPLETTLLAETLDRLRIEVREGYRTLERRVEQRTRALAASAEVSRRLSTIMDRQQLLVSVVDEIQRAFGYYHAHIYLLNESGENLVLVGGTGEAAQTMLRKQHQVPFGRGLVGRAAENRQAVLVSDTSQDTGWLPNPLLPDTKSEAAVPIMLGERVLGVLDVQQNIVNGLEEQDIQLLQSIANQVAVAVQNARVYTLSQQQAERETLVNLMGRRIQSAQTIEGVLQMAIQELQQVTGARRTSIQISAPLERKTTEPGQAHKSAG